MAKVLVLYYSSYGHIERMAQAEAQGARSAGADIATDRDPITAIFEKYYADTPSPRIFPPSVADESR